MLQGGELTVLGVGSSPEMNNVGHVAWTVYDPQTCAYEGDIFFYDGQSVERITDDGFSNARVELNDLDQIVWDRLDFCVDPGYDVYVMLYSAGTIYQLTEQADAAGAASINNLGQIV